MPIYEYRCEACGSSFEVFQKFSDDPVQTCEACGAGPVAKVLHPVAVHFKGSGFYTTDYGRSSSFRTAADKEAGAAAAAAGGSESASTAGGSEGTGATAPAKPAAAEKSAAGNGSGAGKTVVKDRAS